MPNESRPIRMGARSREVVECIAELGGPFYETAVIYEFEIAPAAVYKVMKKLQDAGEIQPVDPPSDAVASRVQHYDFVQGADQTLERIQPTRAAQFMGGIVSIISIR